jgi:hypothetical protein
MTKALIIDALPVPMKEGHSEFTVQLKDPGAVRSVNWVLQKKLVMGRDGAGFDELLTMFVEFSPDGPMRNRRFVVLPTGQGVNIPDGHRLEHVGSAASGNTGRIAHVYEIKPVS